MLNIFKDGPEYEMRKKTPFKPPRATLAEIRARIPRHLHEKSTLKGLYYYFRDIVCALIVYRLGTLIDPYAATALHLGYDSALVRCAQWIAWGLYLYWQGIILAGFWCLAHEAGHGGLSNYNAVNTVIGFSFHTFLLTPYYAWRSTHHAHHAATMSMERDENYVPRTRSDYKLPSAEKAQPIDYHEIFEDVPIYTLLRMLIMQAFGMQCYLFRNSMGNTMYPAGTNHFVPSSPLFKPHERNGIIASNIGLALMSFILRIYAKNVGTANFIRLYFIPYLIANHWIVMLTYLHHSDPTVPHYRDKQWTFIRGALATVDRPLLGWAGRFFLHNISHDHITHHIFSSIPFYNAPLVTEHIKQVLGDDYNYDSTNTFRALYRTFTECCFIEDSGDIIFYKNKDGKAARELAKGALDYVPKSAYA